MRLSIGTVLSNLWRTSEGDVSALDQIKKLRRQHFADPIVHLIAKLCKSDTAVAASGSSTEDIIAKGNTSSKTKSGKKKASTKKAKHKTPSPQPQKNKCSTTTTHQKEACEPTTTSSSHRVTNVAVARWGVRNIGNTCFVASTFQLIMRSGFKLRLRSDRLASSSVRGALHQMINSIGEGRTVDPKPLQTVFTHYLNGKQQDAHEFLGHLLSSLEAEEETLEISGPTSPLRSYNVKQCHVNSTFSSIVAYRSQCRKCASLNVKTNSTHIVNLPIDGSCSLGDALAKFQETSKVEFKCSECDSVQVATHSMYFVRCPPVLLIQLVRFSNSEKNRKAFRHDPKIHLTEYGRSTQLDHSDRSDIVGERVHEYQLAGFVEHHGTSLTNGHYLCRFRAQGHIVEETSTSVGIQQPQQPSTWIVADDQDVRDAQVSNQSEDSYILSYVRTDTTPHCKERSTPAASSAISPPPQHGTDEKLLTCSEEIVQLAAALDQNTKGGYQTQQHLQRALYKQGCRAMDLHNKITRLTAFSSK